MFENRRFGPTENIEGHIRYPSGKENRKMNSEKAKLIVALCVAVSFLADSVGKYFAGSVVKEEKE